MDEERNTKLAPLGSIGEIYLEGPLLAKGYLNDPQKTSEAFPEDLPWLVAARGQSTARRRLYKTGDLAQYNDDGSVRFLGRKDTQIKMRGQRIEANEVEYHVGRLLDQRFEVVVEVIQPGQGASTGALTAFVAVKRSEHATGNTTKALLTSNTTAQECLSPWLTGLGGGLLRSLPAYMVPKYLVPLHQIPQTRSGKVDRKLLRSLGSAMTLEALSDFAVVRSGEVRTSDDSKERERQMAQIWATILHTNVEAIQSADDFFALGGDSINAMQVVTLARTLGLQISTVEIFKNPTLSAMSAIALQNCTEKQDPIESSLPPRLEMSDALDVPRVVGNTARTREMAPDIQAFMVVCGLLRTHGYINFFAFDLNGPIDTVRLERSCRDLADRHSSLHTVFQLRAGRVWQSCPESPHIEIVHMRSEEPTPDLLRSLCTMEKTAFRRIDDMILRFLIISRSTASHALIMRMSHAQFDGTSLHLIYRDLKALYEGARLSPAPQYLDISRAMLSANNSEAERFWRHLLQGSAMTQIIQHLKPSYKHVINDRVTHIVPYGSTQMHGMTLATLIKASWAVVLARLSRSQDVVFGYAVTGRNLPLDGIDQIVGDCNNAALTRIKVDPSSTVLNLLRQVQDQSILAMPYETVGQRQMVEKCTSWPRWTRYSTSVNHQNYAMAGTTSFCIEDAGCIVSYQDLEADRRDIQIYSYPPQDGKVKLAMAFCNEVIEPSLVKVILEELGRTVQRFAADMSAMVAALDNTTDTVLPWIPLMAKDGPVHQEPQVEFRTFRFAFLDMPALVNTVWSKLKECFTENGLSIAQLTRDTPFYEIGGDLVYAAQLSAYYEEEGIVFAMEDLVEHPTQRLQLSVLKTTYDGLFG